MRYRLRTLLIVLAVGPVVLNGLYWGSLAAIRWRDERNAAAVIRRLKEDLRRESAHRRPLSLRRYITPAVAPDRGGEP
jgi:hypothetical protein